MMTREERIEALERKLKWTREDLRINHKEEKDLLRAEAETILNLEEQRMLKDIRDKKVFLVDSETLEWKPVQVFTVN